MEKRRDNALEKTIGSIQEGGGPFLVMADHEDKARLGNFPKQGVDRDGIGFVEGSGRLIGQDEGRVERKGPSQGEPGFLAAGKVRGLSLLLSFKAEAAEQAFGPRTGLDAAPSGREKREHRVFEGRVFKKEIVSLAQIAHIEEAVRIGTLNAAPQKVNGAAIGTLKPGQEVEDRAFP